MTPADLLTFLRRHRLAVQASVFPNAAPEAAVVGIAVTEAFEIVFDTLETSRKASNLRQNAHVAFAIGGLSDGEESTVQYEGVADFPVGHDLDRLKDVYFRVFPDGRERERQPGIVYVRARPHWIRHADFSQEPWSIHEFTAEMLALPKRQA